jgi:PBP1b-binding outer membrane lipoprotein LpoB
VLPAAAGQVYDAKHQREKNMGNQQRGGRVLRITTAIAVFALILAGCTQPLDTRIDSTSQAAYEKSLTAIKAKLTPDETAKLDEALQVVVFSEIVPKDANLFSMMAAFQDTDKLKAKMLQTVNGKTPRELIDIAAGKIKERAKEELKSVTSEIADLEKRKAGAEKAKELLSKIVVTDARFYWSSGFLPHPIIDFKVTNSTGVPLGRLYFHGVVSTPGRTIPWIDHDFNYEIPGGLENAESKHLDLEPNQFSDWGKSETQGRNDLVMTITVVNAEGADKVKLADEFNKEADARLSKLRVMKVELGQKLAAR